MNVFADRLSVRAVTVIVAVITVGGFLLRFNLFGDAVFGDELSTLWIVENHGFTETVSVVHGDAEITPPLYFLLAWLTTHLGSSPELVRLPALIAGTVAIPMTYLFGLRTLGRATGIAAALVLAISPYAIFLSAYGRGYALMITFLLGSALAMLAASRTGRVGWWVVYASCCCLAMYSHYTAAFVLAAQFLWVVWAHPQTRRAALLAVVGAAVLFLPWMTGVLNDLDSPTQAILEFLQGEGLTNKLKSVVQAIAGEPMVALSRLPGEIGLLLLGFGLATGAVGAAWKIWSGRRDPAESDRRPMLILVVITALATLLAELVLMAFGTDLLSDRNLSATWAGLPVLIGALFTLPSLRVGTVAALATIAGLSIGTVKVSDRKISGSAYAKAAGFIEQSASPGDVVLDISHYTPVPLTQLDAYLPREHPEFRPGLPEGLPPYLPFKSPVRPVDEVVGEAFDTAGSNRVFAVTREDSSSDPNLVSHDSTTVPTPRGWKVDETRTWPGFSSVTVTVFVPRRGSASATTGPEGEDQSDHRQAQEEGGQLAAGD